MKLKSLSIILFFLFYSITANSENIYIFSGIGISNFDINSKDLNEINNKLTNIGFGTATTSTKNDNLNYKIGFGFKVPLNLHIESSFVNYGKIKFLSNTTNPTETLNADVEIKGFSLDLLKKLGSFDFTTGLITVNDDIKISSSKGNVDVPIDNFIIPQVGANFNSKNFRFEIKRIFITPNSHINSLMISYMYNIL